MTSHETASHETDLRVALRRDLMRLAAEAKTVYEAVLDGTEQLALERLTDIWNAVVEHGRALKNLTSPETTK